VALYDELRVAWRTGDTSDQTTAFVATALATCGAGNGDRT
jgi:hypothetical protein